MKKILTLAIGGVFAAMLAFPIVSTAETDPLIGKYCLQFEHFGDEMMMQFEMSSLDNYTITGINHVNEGCSFNGGGAKASDDNIYLAVTEVCPNISYTARMSINIDPDIVTDTIMTGTGDAIWSDFEGVVQFTYIAEPLILYPGQCRETGFFPPPSQQAVEVLRGPWTKIKEPTNPTKPSMTGY